MGSHGGCNRYLGVWAPARDNHTPHSSRLLCRLQEATSEAGRRRQEGGGDPGASAWQLGHCQNSTWHCAGHWNNMGLVRLRAHAAWKIRRSACSPSELMTLLSVLLLLPHLFWNPGANDTAHTWRLTVELSGALQPLSSSPFLRGAQKPDVLLRECLAFRLGPSLTALERAAGKATGVRSVRRCACSRVRVGVVLRNRNRYEQHCFVALLLADNAEIRKPFFNAVPAAVTTSEVEAL